MAIYCITGRPRQGKTYWLARLIAGWIKDGERVYSNIWLNLNSPIFKSYYKKFDLSAEKILGDLSCSEDVENPDKQVFYWRHLREWNKMTRGIIVADEGTRYFNPRKWSMLSEETELKLQQHGKEDLDIWLTTQHYSRLDITLRVLVERFFIIEKIIGSSGGVGKCWGIIKITEHFLEDMERLERALGEDKESLTLTKEFMLIRRKFANLYDTRQMVGKPDPMDLWHEERKCLTCGKVHISHT